MYPFVEVLLVCFISVGLMTASALFILNFLEDKDEKRTKK